MFSFHSKWIIAFCWLFSICLLLPSFQYIIWSDTSDDFVLFLINFDPLCLVKHRLEIIWISLLFKLFLSFSLSQLSCILFFFLILLGYNRVHVWFMIGFRNLIRFCQFILEIVKLFFLRSLLLNRRILFVFLFFGFLIGLWLYRFGFFRNWLRLHLLNIWFNDFLFLFLNNFWRLHYRLTSLNLINLWFFSMINFWLFPMVLLFHPHLFLFLIVLFYLLLILNNFWLL